MLHQLHTYAWPPAAAVHWGVQAGGAESNGPLVCFNASLLLSFLKF